MKSGVEFIATDNPHANKIMLHMLAAFAKHERAQISQRTKSALTEANQGGVKLGNNGAALAVTNKQAAHEFAVSMQSTISEIKQRGSVTYRAIAAELNRLAVQTFHRKGKWYAPAVLKVVRRI